MNNERKQKYLNKLMLELEELKKPIQISEESYININHKRREAKIQEKENQIRKLLNKSKQEKIGNTKKMNFLIFILFFIIIILVIIF